MAYYKVTAQNMKDPIYVEAKGVRMMEKLISETYDPANYKFQEVDKARIPANAEVLRSKMAYYKITTYTDYYPIYVKTDNPQLVDKILRDTYDVSPYYIVEKVELNDISNRAKILE